MNQHFSSNTLFSLRTNDNPNWNHDLWIYHGYEYVYSFATGFHNAVAVLREYNHNYIDNPHYYLISLNDIQNLGAFESWMTKKQAIPNYPAYRSNNGLAWQENSYCDADGNSILSPQIPSGVSILSATAFQNGYAALRLKGMDGKHYVVAINQNGEMQYDPIQIDNFETSNWYQDYFSIQNGVIVVTSGNYGYKELYIINRQGTISSTLSIRGMGSVKAQTDDWLYLTAAAIQIDDGSNIVKVIDSVKTNIVIENTPQNVDAGNDGTKKSYVTLNNFSIEGKWKNVGTYTFGQVQDGAIVSFDGTYCNVFSPRDTYACYKNGDDYRLDCTSPLADTLSFTVKIVDKDNIDIYNGSNYLELTRVG